MARHKDGQWDLPDSIQTWDQAQAAILMDIRDELKQLNSTLSWFRVAKMAEATIRIDKRLAKHMPLGPGRKRRA